MTMALRTVSAIIGADIMGGGDSGSREGAHIMTEAELLALATASGFTLEQVEAQIAVESASIGESIALAF